MSDRTSAEIFGNVFVLVARDTTLAKNPKGRNSLALQLWEMSKGYDFGPSQMDCDEALIGLGLARESGSDVEYGPVTGKPVVR